eukprot:evm.model.NODE_8960_length_34018_cov_18.461050.4
MVDKVTGRSRGFGFVSYNNPDSALQAIEAMNGFVVGHKRLKVEQKKDKSSLGMSGMGGSMGGHGAPPSSFSASDTLSPHGSNPSMIGSGGTPAPLHALQRWQAHLASQAALQQQQIQYSGGTPLQQHQQQLAHANIIQQQQHQQHQHQHQQQQHQQHQQKQQQQAGGLVGGDGGPGSGGMGGGEVGPGQGRNFGGGPMAADRSSSQYLAHVAGLYQG